jgi:FkbH-like protein
MGDRVLRLIADFNVDPLAGYLSSNPSTDIHIEVASFGQVYQLLASEVNKPVWGSLIWTLPETSIPTFNQALNFVEINVGQCLDEVDALAQAILKYSVDKQYTFVANWVLPPGYRGYGPLEWRSDLGLSHLLARMNLRLSEQLSVAESIYVLDVNRWLQGIPQPAAPKMWYAAKVPFASKVFEATALDLLSALQASCGKSRRLLILDLDNTLWGGVVGETGWEGIRLGGHDHVGEAFRDFQRELKALSRRGIQLAIVSKNDEQVALDAIDKHPEMILRRDNFAAWRINWDDKAKNIISLVEELNLGINSVVFIDDNPAERERTRGAFPDLLVPEWPSDVAMYVTSLRALDCFDSLTISQEDRDRTAMYKAERARRNNKAIITSLDEWLFSLETKLYVSRVSKLNIVRVAQLFNKTNQLNLSTRRLSEAEILKWVKVDNHSMLAISVSDRFGDMGLVGIIGVEANSSKGRLVDFILSCRVMGRKVEETMIHLAVEALKNMGAASMMAHYLPTDRNRPSLYVFRVSGLKETAENIFEADCIKGFPKPESTTIELTA